MGEVGHELRAATIEAHLIEQLCGGSPTLGAGPAGQQICASHTHAAERNKQILGSRQLFEELGGLKGTSETTLRSTGRAHLRNVLTKQRDLA